MNAELTRLLAKAFDAGADWGMHEMEPMCGEKILAKEQFLDSLGELPELSVILKRCDVTNEVHGSPHAAFVQGITSCFEIIRLWIEELCFK